MSKHKHEIITKVLELLPEPRRLEPHQAFSSWYRNLRDRGGLRLTLDGYNAFRLAGIISHDIELSDIKKIIDKSTLLKLDRKIQFPYYIDFKNQKLVMFSSKEAMMAVLYGDINNWLDSLPQRTSN